MNRVKTCKSIVSLASRIVAVSRCIRPLPLAVLLAWGALSAASVCRADEPDRVTVGAYVNDVQTLNLRDHSYAMDVYIWFRWRDETLAPAETVEMVNPNELWGHVAEPLYDEPIKLPSSSFTSTCCWRLWDGAGWRRARMVDGD